jgi:hypothetical protein
MNLKAHHHASLVLSTSAVAEKLRVKHHLLFVYLERLGWITRYPDRRVTGKVPKGAYVYAGGPSRRILWTPSGCELIRKKIAADIDAARGNRKYIGRLLRADLAGIPAAVSATAEHGPSGSASDRRPSSPSRI